MKTSLILVAAAFIPVVTIGQITNLVPNPSFEHKEVAYLSGTNYGGPGDPIVYVYNGEGTIYKPTDWQVSLSYGWNISTAYYFTPNSYRFYPLNDWGSSPIGDPPDFVTEPDITGGGPGNSLTVSWDIENESDFVPQMGSEYVYEERTIDNEDGYYWGYEPLDNIYGNQNAGQGDSFVGLFATTDNSHNTRYNEVLSCELTTPLTVGEDYTFECLFSAAEGLVNHPLMNNFYKPEYRIRLATGRNSDGEPIGDKYPIENFHVEQTDSWKQIRVEFEADKVYKYLFIEIKKESLAASGQAHHSSGLYVDDVALYVSCRPPGECHTNYNYKISTSQTNWHDGASPFSVTGLEEVEDFEIWIKGTVNGQITNIFHEHIISPPPIWSWEGPPNSIQLPMQAVLVYDYIAKNGCDQLDRTGTISVNNLDPNFMDSYTENYYADVDFNTSTEQIRITNLDIIDNVRIVLTSPGYGVFRTIDVDYPASTIGWDGLDANGNVFPATTVGFKVYVTSYCYGEELIINNSIQHDGNYHSGYPPVSVAKPYMPCDFNFGIIDMTYPNEACCPYAPFQYFEHVNIGYDNQFLVLNKIQTGPNVKITSGSNITFEAGTEILLGPGLVVEPFTHFTAEIKPCVKSTSLTNNEGFSEETNTVNPFMQKQDTTNDENAGSLKVSVSPNPATAVLNITVESDHINLSLQIMDLQGRVLLSKTLIDSNTRLDITHLTKGTYIVSITSDTEKHVEKFVKK